jgi:hypothetical protein
MPVQPSLESRGEVKEEMRRVGSGGGGWEGWMEGWYREMDG